MAKFNLQEDSRVFLGGIVVVLGAVILLWSLNLLPTTRPASAIPTGTPTAPADTTPIVSDPEETTPTPQQLPVPTPTPAAASPTEASSQPAPLPTVTAPPNGTVYRITPIPDAVGWARSGEEQPNHFGDFNVYAGTYDGQTYAGGIRFDLSKIPSGAEIVHADLTLYGLSDEYLGSDGTWSVQLLDWWMQRAWGEKNFFELARDDGAAMTLSPSLSRDDLVVGHANTFDLNDEARTLLEARVYDESVAFRVTGPSTSGTLFSWDAGTGSGSHGLVPMLRVVTESAPATPPPAPTRAYHVITPLPDDFLAAAPIYATATAQATTTGTATPLPGDWVTPVLVRNTPTPGNAATATYAAAVSAARTSLFGTPTPMPANAWTVTPEPTPRYMVAENMLTALPLAASATARANAGSDSAGPVEIVTPIVIQSTPRPANAATATHVAAIATSQVALYGPPTPYPPYAWTATPERLVVPVEELEATPTTTPTPAAIPDEVRGKIAFYSDRLGSPAIFVMNPDGTGVAQLKNEWVYEFAQTQDAISPQSGAEVYVARPPGQDMPQLFVRTPDGTTRKLTDLNGITYDPAWSPTDQRVAFVSQAPGNDEIYVIGTDGSGLRQLTANVWEWDKHPSWAPNGTQIVFMSNRGEAGRRQIWMMNADGSDPRNISDNQFEEWDPVWIK